jgi:hypothetical protein
MMNWGDVKKRAVTLVQERLDKIRVSNDSDIWAISLGDLHRLGHLDETISTTRMRKVIEEFMRSEGRGNLEKIMEPLDASNPKRVAWEALVSFFGKGFADSLDDPSVEWRNSEVDHILPDAHGGIDHPWNYVILPREINNSLRENIDAKSILLSVVAPTAVQNSRELHKFILKHADVKTILPQLFGRDSIFSNLRDEHVQAHVGENEMQIDDELQLPNFNRQRQEVEELRAANYQLQTKVNQLEQQVQTLKLLQDKHVRALAEVLE